MSWAQDNAEKLVLSAGLALLGAVAGLTALNYSTADRVRAAGETATTEPVFEVGQFADLGEQIAKVHPWKVPDSAHRLFISRLVRWDAKNEKIKPFDPRDPIGDGIPPIWKQAHNFPIDDPNVQFLDPDEDGFNNLEEYTAQTSPIDKTAHPPFITKLKVLAYKPRSFHIDFRSYQEVEGKMTLLFELPDAPEPKKRRARLSKGDAFYDWVVEDFRPNVKEVFKEKVGANVLENMSEVDISNRVTGDKLTVVYRKKIDAPFQEGTLVYLIEKKEIPVSKGGTFEFLGAKYRLVSIDGEGAKIAAVDGGKEETLAVCTQDEVRNLRGEAAAPAEGEPPAESQPPMESQPPIDAKPPVTGAPRPPASP